MAREIKGARLYTITRKVEPDNLEAQVQALKDLQKQPGFLTRRPVPEKQANRLIMAFKKRWLSFTHLFSTHKKKPVVVSPTKNASSIPAKDKGIPKRP